MARTTSLNYYWRHPALLAAGWAILVIAWLCFNPFTQAAIFSPSTPTPDFIAAPPLIKSTATQPAALPQTLFLPRLNQKINLETVGRDKNHRINVPRNPARAAWFRESPRPGNLGAAIIAGHVNDFWGSEAAFSNLEQLRSNDKIIITDESGKKWNFVISEMVLVSAHNFPASKIFGPYDEPRLHLITCAGEWLPELKEYDQRLVVMAKLSDA